MEKLEHTQFARVHQHMSVEMVSPRMTKTLEDDNGNQRAVSLIDMIALSCPILTPKWRLHSVLEAHAPTC
jgi:hypothetical protein